MSTGLPSVVGQIRSAQRRSMSFPSASQGVDIKNAYRRAKQYSHLTCNDVLNHKYVLITPQAHAQYSIMEITPKSIADVHYIDTDLTYHTPTIFFSMLLPVPLSHQNSLLAPAYVVFSRGYATKAPRLLGSLAPWLPNLEPRTQASFLISPPLLARLLTPTIH
jgi:hypothetical protein